MRVVIQAQVKGAFETVWSAEMLTAYNEVRERKVMEAEALAHVLANVDRDYQVGVLDKRAGGVKLTLVNALELRTEVRRAIVRATQGCLTHK